MSGPPLFDAADLGRCISCGFCLPACPTYRLTGDEGASPRGRIALMRAVDRGEVDVFDAAAREQGSFCLGCRACEPVCPADVPYGRLLEQLRDAQWTGRRRPLRIRPLLAFAVRPWLIRIAGVLRRAAPATVPAAAPAAASAAVPAAEPAAEPATVPAAESAAGAAVRPGADRLLLGCFERVLFPAVGRAAAATLDGVEVPRDQGCCGALHAHNGDSAAGEEMARRFADGGGRVVSTAGGCSAHLASVLGRDRVIDYAELLLEQAGAVQPITVGGRRARIGLQDSCHLRNGLGVHAQPRTVLAALGDLVEVPGAADCCGAAGTYAILRNRDSRRVLAPKITALKALDLDFLAVVNPGCQRQLAVALRRARLPIRVLHLAQLVALSRTQRESAGPQRRGAVT